MGWVGGWCLPGGQQRGARPGGAGQVDGQVAPAVVGERELCLHVLHEAHVAGRATAAVHALLDQQVGADVPATAAGNLSVFILNIKKTVKMA